MYPNDFSDADYYTSLALRGYDKALYLVPLLISARKPSTTIVQKQKQQAAKDPEEAKEISYYITILSEDNKFINAIQQIYENRHKGFERGYRLFTNHM